MINISIIYKYKKHYLIIIFFYCIILTYFIFGDWGLGIGDWGLGIGSRQGSVCAFS